MSRNTVSLFIHRPSRLQTPAPRKLPYSHYSGAINTNMYYRCSKFSIVSVVGHAKQLPKLDQGCLCSSLVFVLHFLVADYGRPPASWPTAIIFYCWRFYPLTFFRRLISEVSGPIVTKLCHMFGGDCNFFKLSHKFGGSLPQKIWGPKTSKFRISRFDREYLRTGTRYRRSENGVENCNHSPTRIRNLVNSVDKRRKIGPGFRPTQSTFSDAHISAHISGAKGRCRLKISQIVEADQRLLMHTSLGMGLPPTIF